MTLIARAAATALTMTLAMGSAGAVTVIDSFDNGVTTVTDIKNSFGATAAAGINSAMPSGDNTRYYSYSTEPGQTVSLNNQTVPGSMLLAHQGGNSYSYMNLSYGFSTPTDLSGFNRISALGSGSGNGQQSLAFYDTDGDMLVATRAIAGAFGDFIADFASMSCVLAGGSSCDIGSIVSFEFLAGGFDGVAYSHRLDELSLSFASSGPGGPPVAPIPEPSTYALMLAGLGLVVMAARKRKASGQTQG